MKSQLKKIGWVLVLASAIFAKAGVSRAVSFEDVGLTYADAEHRFLPVGSYRGKLDRDAYVDLILQAVPGRAESYLGILIQNETKNKRIDIYMIDPRNNPEGDPTRFGLCPLRVAADGAIGVDHNGDPSLVLNVETGKKGKPRFTIVNANSPNTNGFQGSIRFGDSGSSHLEWLPLEDGPYFEHGVKDPVATVSVESGADAQVAMADQAPYIGDFAAREMFPNLFTLRRVSTRGTGDMRDPIPQMIGIFIKDKGGFLSREKTYFLLVNPSDDSDIRTYRLKK